MSAHLGLAITAFVDGELDHAGRDQVLAHLAHCGTCRAEADLLRGLKHALRGAPPVTPDDLAMRLLASTAGNPVAAPVVATARRHALLRRTAVGGAAVAAGVLVSLRLAGPPVEPDAPVDPTGPGLVYEHVSTANEMPFVGVDVSSVTPPR